MTAALAELKAPAVATSPTRSHANDQLKSELLLQTSQLAKEAGPAGRAWRLRSSTGTKK